MGESSGHAKNKERCCIIQARVLWKINIRILVNAERAVTEDEEKETRKKIKGEKNVYIYTYNFFFKWWTLWTQRTWICMDLQNISSSFTRSDLKHPAHQSQTSCQWRLIITASISAANMCWRTNYITSIADHSAALRSHQPLSQICCFVGL